jgi:hypothetical protein
MPRYRIEYAKQDSARFLSHLELVRVFSRALRRSGLPLVFTQGFSPHPRVSYGPSLGVGVAGRREYLDVELDVRPDAAPGAPDAAPGAPGAYPGVGGAWLSVPDTHRAPAPAGRGPERRGAVLPGPRSRLAGYLSSLSRQFPPGLEIRSMMELPPGAPGIGKAVNCAWYRLALPPEQDPDVWRHALQRLAQSASPLYYRRPRDGKLFDVRPGLKAWRLTEGDGLALDLLVSIDGAAVPLRGLVSTLLSLVPESRNKESGVGTKDLKTDREGMQVFYPASGLLHPTPVFEPALVTRMALLRRIEPDGELINPLGERKQLWEA